MRRFADVLLASLLVVVLSPVALVAALLVRLSVGSPVLFRQERVGLGGRVFVLFKFRTMLPERDGLSDRDRSPRIALALRASGLDEYPQLFNIVRGDMSLIGPRPTLPEQVVRYSAEQERRHIVRPGLTGWAQVNGRNSITWPERIELDLWYIDHRSPMIDLKILWLTALRMVAPTDLYGPGGMNPDFPDTDPPGALSSSNP